MPECDFTRIINKNMGERLLIRVVFDPGAADLSKAHRTSVGSGSLHNLQAIGQD